MIVLTVKLVVAVGSIGFAHGAFIAGNTWWGLVGLLVLLATICAIDYELNDR